MHVQEKRGAPQMCMYIIYHYASFLLSWIFFSFSWSLSSSPTRCMLFSPLQLWNITRKEHQVVLAYTLVSPYWAETQGPPPHR